MGGKYKKDKSRIVTDNERNEKSAIKPQRDNGSANSPECQIMITEGKSTNFVQANETLQSNSQKIDLQYNQSDVGPFIVIIEKPNIDLLSTSEIICELIGKHNLEESRRISPDRLRVKTKSFDSANKIMLSTTIITELKMKAFIPSFYLTSVGVVDDIALEYDLDVLKRQINSSSYQIIGLERMKRIENGVPIDIKKIKIWFRSYNLPNEVRIFGAVFRVRLFVPKPTFCKKCLSFGHTKTTCRNNKEKCFKCAQEIDELHKPHACAQFCKFCKTDAHSTGDILCPQTEFQKKIKYHMVSKKIPFKEARALMEADIVPLTSNSKNGQREAESGESTMTEIVKLNKLCESFKKRTSELISLTQMIAKIAFDEKEKGRDILIYIRDVLSEKQQLYQFNN
ncbi:hypothetical protein DMENIID0001_021800 [Sergentomyia squamirostris]